MSKLPASRTLAHMLKRARFMIAVFLVSQLPMLPQAAISAHHTAPWPDPLVGLGGIPINSVAAFEQTRRPDILRLFSDNIYGETPDAAAQKLVNMKVRVDAVESALGGLAVRKQVTLTFSRVDDSERADEVRAHILLYLPARAEKPVGVFVGLNFDGNQSVDADPGITLPSVWVRDPALAGVPLAKEQSGHIRQVADASTRGSAASQWQLRMILEHGYGLATAYGGDFDPDFIAGIGYGVRPLFFTKSQRMEGAEDWGAIGAWAWGMSRMLDYLESDSAVDGKRIIAFGHSRFGKTALWAGAQDERFAAVISNNSGQAGATLSHRKVGETTDHLILAFPYWFCPNYHRYLGRVDALPVDGHLLLALIAPRPLYVASGESDPFSDPMGEFLAARAATSVYHLFGKQGIETDVMPELDEPTGSTLRYHIRPGGHDVTRWDWQQYLKFADQLR